MVVFHSDRDNQEAINHGNKSAAIKRSSSIHVPVARECERKLRKRFCAEEWIHATCSARTRYPECASSIHTTISTRPGECKSADLIFLHVPHSGRLRRRSDLALQTQIHDNDPLRRTTYASHSFHLMRSQTCLRIEGCTGAHGLIHHLGDKLPDSG